MGKVKEVQKEKASASIEQIFAHAVALNQSGRLKNTIFCLGKTIYIKNADNTVLMRFFSPDGSFKNPVSFQANDYEGDSFYEEDGKIVFETNETGFTKEKSCRVPGQNSEDIKILYDKYAGKPKNYVTISSDILTLLNPRLSHVELSVKKGKFILVQRDIYSGSTTVIKKKDGRLGISSDNLKGSFGPIGLRTSDFESLFTFSDSLVFFLDPALGYVVVTGTKWKMRTIIGTCLYDEMGTIKYIKTKKVRKGKDK